MEVNTQRQLLGMSGWAQRISVFLAGDCVEAEARDYADIQRYRIYLDDIAMLATCKRINIFFVIQMAVSGSVTLFALMLITAVAFSGTAPKNADLYLILAFFGATVLLIFGLLAFHLVVKEDTIVIYGRRKKVEIRFGYFKRAAFQQSFTTLSAAVKAAIARTNERLDCERPPAPPAEESLPLPPQMDAVIPPSEILPATVPEPRAQASGPFIPVPAPIPAPPTLDQAFHIAEDGANVEYLPREAPAASPTAPAPPRPSEPDLPFLPEIKIQPKPTEPKNDA